MVTQFPADYAHCAVLGVMKKLLYTLVSGTLRVRLKGDVIDSLSLRLLRLAEFTPSEFSRRPRSLTQLRNWKATEFRMFLCYTGVVVLRDLVAPEIYGNYLLLMSAMRILLTPDDCILRNDLAQQLLSNFVQHSIALYGTAIATYNVHVLIHLPADAMKYNNLDYVSAFPFESYLYQLKRLLRKPSCTLRQVVNRLYQLRNLESRPADVAAKKFLWSHDDGPLTPNTLGGMQYRAVLQGFSRYSTSRRDSCIMTEEGDIALIRNVVHKNDVPQLVISKFQSKTPLFDKPIDSTDASIYHVSRMDTQLYDCAVESVKKVFLMPINLDDDTEYAAAVLLESLGRL